MTATAAARRYLVDRVIRVTKPHRLLDPEAGPLIAVRMSILTRKTLGGLHTDLSGRVLQGSGEPLGGLFAAGEVAGFGGGGVHGYRPRRDVPGRLPLLGPRRRASRSRLIGGDPTSARSRRSKPKDAIHTKESRRIQLVVATPERGGL